MKSAISISLLVIMLACKNDDDLRPELDVITDRFFEEAASRNIDLDRSKLVIKLVPGTEISPGIGLSQFEPPMSRIASEVWDKISPVQKEMLVFHELGHSMLKRDDTYGKLPNCIDYKTLMTSADFFAVISEEVYTERRQYYVDELFNPGIDNPPWGGTFPINKTNIIDNSTDWEFLAADGSNHTGSMDNTTHEMSIISGSGQRGQAYWTITSPDIPGGASIVVTYDVKAVNISQPGAYVWLLGSLDFQNTNYITGSSDWQTQKLVISCYPSSKPPLTLKLGLNGTASGTVLFNNVKVDYYN